MGRDELQQRMDEVTRRYARTHDPKYKLEMWELNDRLVEMRKVEDSIAVLEHARARCRTEDVRIAEVYAALDYLAARAEQNWPFQQFRKALDENGTEGTQAEGRWQVLNASLNAIKLILGKPPRRQIP